MCLVRSRPAWEEDVTFANRPSRRHSRRHVSETITTRRRDPPPVTYIEAPPPPPPRVSTPIIRPITPPPPPTRIELVSVEEDMPRTSHVSVSVSDHRRKRRSTSGEEVYIERERERVRIPQPVEKREEHDTYRYVQGPDRIVERVVEDPRRSITYETNPRNSQRVVERERERVVERDGDRRREYYRRP